MNYLCPRCSGAVIAPPPGTTTCPYCGWLFEVPSLSAATTDWAATQADRQYARRIKRAADWEVLGAGMGLFTSLVQLALWLLFGYFLLSCAGIL